MTQNDQKTNTSQPALCIKCKDLYGNSLTDNMCSQCYKKQKSITHIQLTDNTPSPQPVNHLDQKTENQEENSKKRPHPQNETPSHIKGKCSKCNKKTGILSHECKHCNYEFCRRHRLPEEHECQVDFITLGRKIIKQANPQVSLKKIEQI